MSDPTNTPPPPDASAAQITALQNQVNELKSLMDSTKDADGKAALAKLHDTSTATLAALTDMKTRMDKADETARTMTEKAKAVAISASIKEAAKAAGAVDAADVLQFIKASDVKLNADGEPENVAELVEAFKKTKPHFFGAVTTSTTDKPPPKSDPSPFHASKATEAEYEAKMKEMGLDPKRFRRT
jgi:hypothetical protein